MVVLLRDSDNVEVRFIVCHFSDDPVLHAQQWKDVPVEGALPTVVLADCNLILDQGLDSLTITEESHDATKARGVELSQVRDLSLVGSVDGAVPVEI